MLRLHVMLRVELRMSLRLVIVRLGTRLGGGIVWYLRLHSILRRGNHHDRIVASILLLHLLRLRRLLLLHLLRMSCVLIAAIALWQHVLLGVLAPVVVILVHGARNSMYHDPVTLHHDLAIIQALFYPASFYVVCQSA